MKIWNQETLCSNLSQDVKSVASFYLSFNSQSHTIYRKWNPFLPFFRFHFGKKNTKHYILRVKVKRSQINCFFDTSKRSPQKSWFLMITCNEVTKKEPWKKRSLVG